MPMTTAEKQKFIDLATTLGYDYSLMDQSVNNLGSRPVSVEGTNVVVSDIVTLTLTKRVTIDMTSV